MVRKRNDMDSQRESEGEEAERALKKRLLKGLRLL